MTSLILYNDKKYIELSIKSKITVDKTVFASKEDLCISPALEKDSYTKGEEDIKSGNKYQFSKCGRFFKVKA